MHAETFDFEVYIYIYIYVCIYVCSQVVQETNFRFLKAFLEKFSVQFPTAKELEVILAMFVHPQEFWL